MITRSMLNRPFLAWHETRILYRYQRGISSIKSKVATPLPFVPKTCQITKKALPLFLKDTASILNPNHVHLSPCFGAALTTSPLIGNLLRLSEHCHGVSTRTSQTASLCSQLFFQMIRESSIFVTRSKSMPAAYLSPRLIGTIVGQSRVQSEETEIQTYLKQNYGIQSNKIGDNQWTGVSLTRWLDLFRLSSDNDTCLEVWLTALWETCQNKADWLDYLIECDYHFLSATNESIFRQNSSLARALKIKDPVAMQEWHQSAFSPDDLALSNVQKSMDQLLYYYSTPLKNNDQWAEVSRALEIVCAATALRQTSSSGQKPVVPNGYYGYDGGDLKADCAEATIREIISLLLWDGSSGAFDISRLPKKAVPELIDFYTSPSEGPGQQWFDLMSDLPGCDYFVQGRINGKPYELAPTMDNIAKACQILLFPETAETAWASLHDLSKAWHASDLIVQTDTLLHPTNTNKSGDMVARHEFATLQMSKDSIEIRMRCVWNQKSGFCAVTHLKEERPCLSTSQKEKLRDLIRGDNYDSQAMRMLSLALVPDTGLLHQREQGNVETLVLDLCSTPLGCDRRGRVLDSIEEEQEQFSEHELETSRGLLKAALYRICNLHRQDPETCRVLFSWILQESPTVIESSSLENSLAHEKELEQTILSLPPEILGNPMVQNALYNNDWGMIRGQLLTACAQYKSGKASLLDIVFGDLTPQEVLSVLSLLYSSSKRTT